MRRLTATLAMLLAATILGCSLARIAQLPPDLGDPDETRALIEGCLSSIGMLDRSHEWPLSEIIADEPDCISAWDTPPAKSKWEYFFDTYKGARAWVMLSEGRWSVRFIGDEPFPKAFADCIAEAKPGVSVEIVNDWYFDLS
jgi:hypothetical protein